MAVYMCISKTRTVSSVAGVSGRLSPRGMHVCIYIYIYTYIHISLSLSIYISLYIYIYTHKHTRAYIGGGSAPQSACYRGQVCKTKRNNK